MFPVILYLIGGISALVVDRLGLIKNKKLMPWFVFASVILFFPLRVYGENIFTHTMMAMAIFLFALGFSNWIRNIFKDWLRIFVEEIIDEKSKKIIRIGGAGPHSMQDGADPSADRRRFWKSRRPSLFQSATPLQRAWNGNLPSEVWRRRFGIHPPAPHQTNFDGVLLAVVARPARWKGPQPCRRHPPVLDIQQTAGVP